MTGFSIRSTRSYEDYTLEQILLDGNGYIAEQTKADFFDDVDCFASNFWRYFENLECGLSADVYSARQKELSEREGIYAAAIKSTDSGPHRVISPTGTSLFEYAKEFQYISNEKIGWTQEDYQEHCRLLVDFLDNDLKPLHRFLQKQDQFRLLCDEFNKRNIEPRFFEADTAPHTAGKEKDLRITYIACVLIKSAQRIKKFGLNYYPTKKAQDLAQKLFIELDKDLMDHLLLGWCAEIANGMELPDSKVRVKSESRVFDIYFDDLMRHLWILFKFSDAKTENRPNAEVVEAALGLTGFNRGERQLHRRISKWTSTL